MTPAAGSEERFWRRDGSPCATSSLLHFGSPPSGRCVQILPLPLQVKVVARAAREDEDGGSAEAKADGAAAKADALASALNSKRGELAAWCGNAYGEAFVAWVHVCAVRLFVESVLRYGLPPRFLGAIIEPERRQEAKARKVLAGAFGAHGAQFWAPDGNDGAAPAVAGVGDRGDMHPYVSFTIDLDGV